MLRSKKLISGFLAVAMVFSMSFVTTSKSAFIAEAATTEGGIDVYSTANGDVWSGANIILGDNTAQWPYATGLSEKNDPVPVAFVPEKDATYRLSFNVTSTGAPGFRVRWTSDNENGSYTAKDSEVVSNYKYAANEVAKFVPAYFENTIANNETLTYNVDFTMNGSESANGLIGNIVIRGQQGSSDFQINWISIKDNGGNTVASWGAVPAQAAETAAPVAEVAPAPVATFSDDAIVLYEMDKDPSLVVGGGLGSFLTDSGDGDISVINGNDGTIAIEVNNRRNNYDGVDLLLDALKKDGVFLSGKYTIEVTGHALEGQEIRGKEFVLGMSASPYGELCKLTPNADGSFVLSITREYTPSDLFILGYNYRIQGASGVLTNFCIDNIRVVIEGASDSSSSISEVYRYTFDNQASQSSLFTVMASSQIEWVNGSGLGQNSDTALKVTHIDGKSYTGADNAVRLTLPEALPAGSVYKVTSWYFVPAAENANKAALTGPGFVINGDYGGATGESKFPNDPGTIAVGEWKELTVIMPMSQEPIRTLDFRYVVNDEPKHPDVWYLDTIVVSRVGEAVEIQVPEWDLSLPSLYKAYADYFKFGNLMEPNQVDDTQTTEMFARSYNVVTAENAMKPINISRTKGVYSFEGSDKLIDWALENNIEVHGHTLVWHSQSTPWVNLDDNGKPLTRAEAKANMENYINSVAGHFKGRVISWDVVNEAFSDGKSSSDWREVLRTDDAPWYLAYSNGADESKGEHGSDYIYDAFVLTRLADPGATLYYNDFNEELTNKRDAIVAMIKELNAKWKTDSRNTEPNRLLIEGMGMQSHHFTDGLSVAAVEEAIKLYIETGVELSVTELDIPLGTYANYTKRTTAPTDEEYAKQAELYRQLFEVYKKYSPEIVRVTIWGKADSQSWRSEGYPVMFDKLFNPKASFYAILDAASKGGAVTVPVAPTATASYKDTVNHPAKEAIEKVTKAGIFSGVTKNSFKPDDAFTRSMGVSVLWRMAGNPTVDSSHSFADVVANSWYAPSVAWASYAGIIENSKTTFNPNDALTYQELLTMLNNYAKTQDNIDTPVLGALVLGFDANRALNRADAAAIIAKILK